MPDLSEPTRLPAQPTPRQPYPPPQSPPTPTGRWRPPGRRPTLQPPTPAGRWRPSERPRPIPQPPTPPWRRKLVFTPSLVPTQPKPQESAPSSSQASQNSMLSPGQQSQTTQGSRWGGSDLDTRKDILPVSTPSLALLKQQDIHAWNQQRQQHPDYTPDLQGADLSGLDLRGVNLSSANLSGTNLRKANLSKADLSGAKLSRTDLSSVNLSGALLKNADLTGANLQNALLFGADLTGADLQNANLKGTYLYGTVLNHTTLENSILNRTIFANVDLSKTEGLTNIAHEGPSVIGLDTVARSSGHIPESFLRSASVAEPLIASLRTANMLLPNSSAPGAGLPGQEEWFSPSSARQLNSQTWLCCAHEDKDFAERLLSDLRQEGISCRLHIDEINTDEIHTNDRVVLLLSQSSMQSLWLKKAVKILRQREEQLHKRILFLIRLDNAPIMTIMQEWAASSRSLPGIEDFTRGQGEAFYQSALHKLLKALQTEA